jgi:hypothetical protein
MFTGVQFTLESDGVSSDPMKVSADRGRTPLFKVKAGRVKGVAGGM